MKDRTYRTILGALLLLFLYFDLITAIYVLIAVSAFEGISNLRIPIMVWWLRTHNAPPKGNSDSLAPLHTLTKMNFEAERAFRLSIVLFLSSAYLVPGGILWWVPWFMGFAILGAGVSGVCPVYFSLRWIGFSDSRTVSNPDQDGTPIQPVQ